MNDEVANEIEADAEEAAFPQERVLMSGLRAAVESLLGDVPAVEPTWPEDTSHMNAFTYGRRQILELVARYVGIDIDAAFATSSPALSAASEGGLGRNTQPALGWYILVRSPGGRAWEPDWSGLLHEEWSDTFDDAEKAVAAGYEVAICALCPEHPLSAT